MAASNLSVPVDLTTLTGTPFTVPAYGIVEAPGDFEPVEGVVKLQGSPGDLAELGRTMHLGHAEKMRRRARGRAQRNSRRRNR